LAYRRAVENGWESEAGGADEVDGAAVASGGVGGVVHVGGGDLEIRQSVTVVVTVGGEASS
jgi:hypothetical protein